MRNFFTRPSLTLTLCAWATIFSLRLAAQEPGIIRRYAIHTQDTSRHSKTARGTAAFFLVHASVEKARQLQLKRSLSPSFHIVQHRPEDSSIAWWPANGNWKASETLLLAVEAAKEKDSIGVLSGISAYARFVRWEIKGRVAMQKVAKRDWEKFIGDTAIRFADSRRIAKPEILITSTDPGLNRITTVWQRLPDLRGDGLRVSIKETLFDTADADLRQRYIPTALAAVQTEPHSTIMATFIAGAGNSGAAGKGVAPGTLMASSSFDRLSADDITYFTQHGIALQNHSYGTGIENYYGLEAVAYDEQVYAADTLLHVFSSGNSGQQTSATGPYSGIAGRANLSGTFKQAKNVLVVGGTESNNTVPAASSKGPAYDGRIKPEIVAYGKDGTSGAAALASGTGLLLQQLYRRQHASLPPASLLKAVLVNSADDIAQPGADHSSGFGALNAWEAAQTMRSNRFAIAGVTNGNEHTQLLDIPAGTAFCKVTLSYTDLPAALNSAQALVNDLDLYLSDAAGNTYLPWTLRTEPDAAALGAPAQRGRDSINNTEQVFISVPPAGACTIHIKGTRVTGTQKFALAWQLVPQDHFEWQSPAENEAVPAGEAFALRWKSTIPAKGLVSYSLNNGASWQPVGDSVELQHDGLSWPVPGLLSPALLKMETAGRTFTSPPFLISPRLRLQTGFNCADSALIYWNQLQGASHYIVYALSGPEMTAYVQTTDTFLVLRKNAALPAWFAVQPFAGSRPGLASNSLPYARQGLDCYTRQFTADLLEDGQVLLQLQLGSTYGLRQIGWERLGKQDWQSLGRQPVSSATSYSTQDGQPPEGIVYYRAAMETLTGSVVYTEPIAVSILQRGDFLIFPNPAVHTLQLLSRNIQDRDLYILNAQGRIVKQVKVTDLQQAVTLNGLPAGAYWCVVYEGAQKVFTAPFIRL